MEREEWLEKNTFHHRTFSDISKLVDLKREKGLKISVAMPTLNEEMTIAAEVIIVRSEFIDRTGLVDEVAIIDSGSVDRTCETALKYGAKVFMADEILPEMGLHRGKGDSLWKSLYVLDGDIILWLDADIRNIHPRFIYGLLGPLLTYDHIGYVKAFYERPIEVDDTMRFSGGGRVTQLLIRPLFNLFYPDLGSLIQPLSGEYAGRREILEQLPFFIGYGVETGLLIDIYKRFGIECIAQTDLDRRIHRNHSLSVLSKMSFAILQTFLARAEELGTLKLMQDINNTMVAIRRKGERLITEESEFDVVERPPMIEVESYRKKRGLPPLEKEGE